MAKNVHLAFLLFTLTYVSCRSRVHRVDETSLHLKNISLEDTSNAVLYFEHELSPSSPSQNHFYRATVSRDDQRWNNCWNDIREPSSTVSITGADGTKLAEVVLSFPFLFYGRFVDKIFISSKGFILVGDATEQSSHIAVLMTRSNHKDTFFYRDNGTSLTVQWENMTLENIDASYTFQVTLFDDGVISFAYKTVPLTVKELKDKDVKVIVGLTGAFGDEMDQLDLMDITDINNHTCIKFMPLKNYYNYDIESDIYEDDDMFDLSPTDLRFVQSGSTKVKREIGAGHEFDNGMDEYSDVDVTAPPDDADSKILHDHHFYYNSTMYMEKEKWEELWSDLDSTENKNVHIMLSNSYRKGVTVPLSFDFPFYGHRIRNITITTGGFLFTGSQVHSWLAATQYIAPLMANFDPSVKNFSVVKYIDNGTALTVQWENVMLKDKLQGNFTFQVTLLNTGDIAFVYKEVPMSVTLISDDDHPVKVGLSDAYIIDRTIFFMRRKTIYEYHRVDLKKAVISNTTSIYFTALPTCISLKNCSACLSLKAHIGFECMWCSGRCSDGIDRNRQDWILQGCGQQSEPQTCPETDVPTYEHAATTEGPGNIPGVSSTLSEVTSTLSSLFPVSQSAPYENFTRSSYDNVSATQSPSQGMVDAHRSAERYPGDVDHVSLGTAGIIGVLFVVSMLVGFVFWVFYAYRNPHTTSGQLLIKYRPNQWHWPRSEARYMAASVHM